MFTIPSLSHFQEKLQNLKEKNNLKGSSLNFRLQKPQKKGAAVSQIVRLLLNPQNSNFDPFIETHQHFGVGSFGTIPCNKLNFNESCAICDHVKDIYNHANQIAVKRGIDPKSYDNMVADAEIKGLFKLAKNIKAKPRIYATLIVRGKEEEGPKYWGIGENFFKILLTAITKKVTRNPAKNPNDPYNGIDIELTLTNDDSDYGTTTFDILSDEDPTPAIPGKTNEEIDEVIKAVPSVWKTICQRKTAEEVENMVDQLIGDNGLIDLTNTSKEESVTVSNAKTAPAPAASTPPKASNGKSVTDAIDDIDSIDDMNDEI